ncbi:hypothetical protein SLA2020_420560 [Shorea laevis]
MQVLLLAKGSKEFLKSSRVASKAYFRPYMHPTVPLPRSPPEANIKWPYLEALVGQGLGLTNALAEIASPSLKLHYRRLRTPTVMK